MVPGSGIDIVQRQLDSLDCRLSTVGTMTEITRIERRSFADQAFELIEAAIVKGDLLPGTRVREAVLAEQFGISRGPLREALGRLEGRQLVRRIPGVGVRVAELNPEDILEVFDVREALEGMAARLAAQNVSGRELDRIEKVVEQHGSRESRQRVPGYFQRPGQSDFHYALVHACGNRWLTGIFDQIYYPLRIFRYRSSLKAGRTEEALEEHRAILAAVRAGNADDAERLMRDHIVKARESCAKLVQLRDRESHRADEQTGEQPGDGAERASP